jgi:hypothetical protein
MGVELIELQAVIFGAYTLAAEGSTRLTVILAARSAARIQRFPLYFIA